MKRFVLTVAFLLFCLVPALAQVSLTATGGTTTGSYTTVNAAFAAINAGTHTGSIVIGISGNTTETAACVLNSSGAGSASYASVLIQPTADGVTISGPTVTGRGLIELNGADNVTINGDNPNTSGVNRNLTITNSATATVAYSMAIRIAIDATTATTADNITIKNCIINGNATGRNASANTSTTASENASYGIYAGNRNVTTAGTNAPGAISSVSTLIGSGTYSNLIIDNNVINAAGRGIAIQGSAATVATGLQITNNQIGATTLGAATNIYSMGIVASGSSNGIIRGNTINNVESYLATSTRAIDIGSISAVAADAFTIENNTISNVINRNTGGYAAYGINIAGGTGHNIRNNFIYGLNAVQNNSATGTTFGVRGIRLTGGTNHKVYYNSIYLTGAMLGTATDASACLTITGTGITGVDARNNIFANTQTGTSTSQIMGIQLPSGATSSLALTLNNNAFFSGSASNQSILGLTSGTYYSAGNFTPSATTGTTNARTYTSTLSTAGTNDNASMAFTTTVPFTSATNLHIPAATSTRLESGGVSISGLTTDIDGDTRPGPSGSVNGGATAPDIGADEFDGTPAVPCTTPSAATSTAITTASTTATSIAGTITAPATAPTGYLVVYSTSATLSAGPVDGTAYSAGTALGGGTVGYAGTATSYTISSLTSNTNYYVFVYTYNSGTCLAGPKYSATSVTANAVTCAAAPTALAASTTNNSASITWTAAAAGGAFGTISYTLQVYSDSGYTTLVNSYSNVTSGYSITSLTANTTYYYRVVSSNGSCGTTANGGAFTTACDPATLTATQGFNAATIPSCWSTGLANATQTGTKISYVTTGSNPTTSPNEGSNMVMYNSYSSTNGGAGSEERLISLPFTTTGLTSVDVTFDWRNENSTSYNSGNYLNEGVQLQYSYDKVTWTNFGSFYPRYDSSITSGTAQWKNKIVTSTAFANQPIVYVAFKFHSEYGNNLFMDNVVIRSTPVCSEPTAATTGAVSNNTAAVSWSAPTTAPSNGYEYYFSTTNTAPTAGTAATGTVAAGTTTASFTALSGNTTYYWWVRSACGTTDRSAWTSGGSFTTMCDPVAAINQNFDSVTTPALPSCWSKIIRGTTVSSFATVTTSTTSVVSSPNGVALYNSGSGTDDDIMLVTPLISNLNDGLHQVRFNARNSTSGVDVQVGVLTGYGSTATFTSLQTVALTTTMAEYTVSFATYTGSGNAIALRMVNGTTYSYVYLDDFKWELIPTCFKPTGVTVSATTTTTATFNWTAPTQGTPSRYEYEIRSSGAAGSGSAGLEASGFVNAPATTATASGLAHSSTYSLYIRTNCGGSDNSEWTNATTVNTACSPVSSLPWSENFDSMTTLGNAILPNCWGNSSTNATYSFTSANAASQTYNDPRSTPNYVTLHWLSGSEAYLWTPGMQLTAGESYTFSYYWAGDGYTGWAGEVYSNTSQSSTGASQLGAAFVAAATTTGTGYTLVTRTFVPTTTGVYYFGIRVTSDSVPYYLGFDDFSVVKTPSSITSFTPNAVCSSSATTVTITGVNLTGATSVKFNGVNATSYTVVNSTTINAVAPTGLTTGAITVVTPLNTATSSTNFTVTTNPTVPVITGDDDGAVCIGTPLTLSNATTGGVWTTSNDAVATVNPTTGVVTGVTPGIVTISYTVTNAGCSTTRNTTLDVYTPPTIVSASGNQTQTEGSTATFTVTASGDVTGYQWQVNTGSGWNNVSNDATYSGATTATLTVSNVASAMNNYQYRVIVSGNAPCGQATSNAASLIISTIGITSQPADVTICSTTTTASYSVTATGTGLTYQWQVNTGSSWTDLVGETSSTLNLSGITTAYNGYKYHVIITDSNATTATSSEVYLYVNQELAVTSQPSNQGACFGSASAKTFTVAYTGASTGIQWQYSANGTSWVALTSTPPAGVSYSGGASNTLTVNTGASTPMGTYYYRAIISGASPCGDVTTNAATLSVYTATITASASSSTYCNPGTGVTLTAAGGATYTWAPATGLSATTGASVIATPSATTTYTVTGTDANGCVNTATVTVNVSNAPTVAAAASASAVCSGQNVSLSATGAVAFTTGNVSTYGFAASTGATLQDMTSATTIGSASNDDTPYAASNIGFTFNYNGVDYTQFSASPDGFITLGATTASSQYTNDLTSTTNPVKIAAYWDDLALGATGNGGYVKYIVTGTAPSRICKIEWFVTIPRNTTGTPSSKFQIWLYESTNAIDFRYGTMGSDTSATASVGLRATGTNNFQSVTISSNTAVAGTANDSNALQPAAGTKYTFTPVQPTLSYAWTSIPAGFASGEQNPTATLTANTTYVVTATTSDGCTATASVAVTNNTPTVADITGNTGTMCTSATVDLDSATTGGVWSTSNDAIATVDASTGVVTGVAQGTVTITYTVTANGCSNFKTTTINVYVAPAISSATGNQTVTPGSTATYSVSATGSNLAYQWQVNTGSGWTNISDDTNYAGTSTATLTVSNVTIGMNGYQYRATVSGTAPCSAVTSTPASLIISDIGITTQPQDVTMCSTSTTASFSVTATGTGLTYQWQVNTGSGWGNLTGETASTLSLSGITTAYNGYQYRVIITDSTATTATSSVVTLTVNSPATITTQATSQGVCFGAAGSKTFTIVRTGTEAIQWQYSANGTSGWANVANATPAGVTYSGAVTNALTVSTSASTAAGVYYFRAVIDSASPCDDTVSSVVTLTVSQPTVTASASSSTYCSPGTGVTLTASGAVSYSWSPATGLSATTGASVVASPSANTTYTVTGTNEFGCTTTATVTVTVSSTPSATAVAAASEVCSGSTVQLDVNSAVAFTTPAVSAYQFTNTTGTYTPVSSSATAVPTVLADFAISATLPIGFTFNYGGNNYTQFKMASDGFITLNTAQTSSIGTNNLGTANANARPIIAPLWDDLDGNATGGSYAGYELTGTAPNRVLTVEWRNWEWNYASTSPVISFQVKLYEGTNNIEFVYRSESGSVATGSASIGLGAPTGNGSGSYLNLSSITTPAVSSTTSTTGLSTKPATGTIYRFVPGNAPALTYAWTSVPAGFTSSVKNPVATVNANTTYYVTVTAPSGCTNTSNVTVNATSGVNITTQPAASTSICQGSNFTLTVVATGPGLTYQWRKGGNNITGATSSSYTVTGAAVTDSANYDVVITPTCGSAVTSNVATVTVNPTPTVTAPSSMVVCAGATVSATTLSGSPSGVTYDITGGAAVGLANQTNVTSIPAFTASSTTTSAVVTITPKANGCTGTPVSFSITVSSLPSAVSVAATGTPLCNGTVATLTASGGSYTNTLYNETFDSLPTSYVASGTTASATINNTYYAQGTGSLLFTNSTISSTATYALNANVNLNGYATAQLTFNHIAALEGPTTTYDIAYVQYSTDGGTTWSYFPASSYAGAGTLVASSTGVSFSTRSYADWISQFTGSAITPGTGPATSLWKQETINIPTAALTSQFRLRFMYTADSSTFYYGWLIDNVKITGTGTSTYTWSPSTGLYTDLAATTAYTGGARATVYAKPTSTTTYTVTAAAISGCTTTATSTVTVNAASAPSATDQQFCAGATVANLVATGSNIQWYAAATGGSALASTTALSPTTYYASQTINGCESTRTPVVVTLLSSWTGAVSADWTNPANWCGNTLPTAAVDVIVPAVATLPVITTGNTALAHNLTLSANATLTVQTGATLSVENILSVNPTATLTVQNNGALIQGSSTVTDANSGNIVFTKNGNSLYRYDYTMWSSPVAGQNLAAFSPATVSNRFYTYNPVTDQYARVTPADNTFAPAKGYLIRMPDTYPAITGYDSGATAVSFTGTFTGAPNNGTVNYTLSTAGNGFNGVGNPYPSPINLSAFFAANSSSINASSGIYLWRKKNNGQSSSYATLTLAAYTANPATGGGSENSSYYVYDPTNGSNNWLIAPGQGFIVKTNATSGTPTLTFTNAMRRPTPGTSQAFFRQQADTNSRMWINMTAANGTASQTAIAYLHEGTLGMDYGYDGEKFTDANTLAVYSIAETKALAVQARPQFNNADIVPVGFFAPAAGTYTISIDHVDGVFANGQTVFLRDNVEGIIRNLSNDSYTFATEAGTFDTRFEILYNTEALGTDVPTINPDNVVVYKQGTTIQINTGSTIMNDITVYDIRGRKIYSASNINNTQTAINNLTAEQQVLIVEINTVKGKVSKRIIY